MPIQDLLLYDVQVRHDQNKILGEKVAEVVRRNIHLAQQTSSPYETPSKKLKKDPIMGLVTKTVATYMFLKHNNGQKRNNNNPEMEDFSSWGEPFFKNKEWKQKQNKWKKSKRWQQENKFKRKWKQENKHKRKQKKKKPERWKPEEKI